MSKKYFIETYGCQMNVHDSERMAGLLEDMGYERTQRAGEAEVILMNTCSVREKPEQKLYSEVGRFRRLKQNNPNLVIGVAGCMAPRESDNIRARAPYVDLLLGPRSLYRLPQLIRQVQMQRQPVDAVDLLDDPTPVTPIRRASNVSAWVDIMFGCNYKCTFCAVPSARGKEVSRPPQEILNEVEELLGLGYKEVTLLGQTVNAYGRDLKDFRFQISDFRLDGSHPKDDPSGQVSAKVDFAYLLEQVDALARRYGQSKFRFRFTSPHPQLATDRLIEAMAGLSTVCEHFHLPVQSGDDAVLHRMKRTYTTRRYHEIVQYLRERIPDVAITTDAIVGFPGETEEQFQNTLRLFEQVQFDQAFMFAYSPRRMTEAADYPDQVPEDVKKRRLQALIALQNEISTRKNQRLIGKVFEVLVEGPSEKNPNRLSGRTRTNKLMMFEGNSRPGQLVKVRAEQAYLWGFLGTPVEQPVESEDLCLIPLTAL